MIVVVVVVVVVSCFSYICDTGECFEWFMSYTPYLIHENSIAPHITSTGVFLVKYSLHVEKLVSYRVISYCLSWMLTHNA